MMGEYLVQSVVSTIIGDFIRILVTEHKEDVKEAKELGQEVYHKIVSQHVRLRIPTGKTPIRNPVINDKSPIDYFPNPRKTSMISNISSNTSTPTDRYARAQNDLSKKYNATKNDLYNKISRNIYNLPDLISKEEDEKVKKYIQIVLDSIMKKSG